MGFGDEMDEYYDEIFSEKCYYQLIVPTGTYSADNIFGLMWEMTKHRFWHWRKGHGWMD